jgi:hypothetical protein
MRYFGREVDVKAIVEAVLKVRELERSNADVTVTDFTLPLGDAYRDWTAEFIDTIADFAARDARVARPQLAPCTLRASAHCRSAAPCCHAPRSGGAAVGRDSHRCRR